MKKSLLLLVTILMAPGAFARSIVCQNDGNEKYTFQAEINSYSNPTLSDYSLSLEDSLTSNPVAYGSSTEKDSAYTPVNPLYAEMNRYYLDTQIDGQYQILLPNRIRDEFTAYLRLTYGPEDDFSQHTMTCHYVNDCRQESKEAALSLYLLNAGVIQGGDPQVGVVSSQVEDGVRNTIVSIDDQNDEGEYWTVEYLVSAEAEFCQIHSVTELEVER